MRLSKIMRRFVLALLLSASLQGIAGQTTDLPATQASSTTSTTAAPSTSVPVVTTAASATPAAASTAPTVAVAAPTVDLSGYNTPSTGAIAGNTSALLTTQTQKNQPTIIVDGGGNVVDFKGIGWYGFNIGLAALGNLSAGPDAVSNDFKQIVYRIRMLGFNSIRVAFAFDNVWGINGPIVDWTAPCTVPTDEAIMQTLIPSANASTTLKSNSDTLPPLLPPTTNGTCNADWPQTSTYERFIWVVDYLISEGFYVMLDFHSNRYGDSLAEGNESLYNQPSWVASWVALITSLLDNIPAATGRLLIDLINEPDGYALTWETQGKVPSLGSYYIEAIDAMYPVCPGCLYLIEGGGQATICGVNWGNGFVTNSSVIGESGVTTPESFFNTILTKPWLNQVVLAPHIYCPEVSAATSCFSGSSLWDSLDNSFGYLTVAPGWCSTNTSAPANSCHVFPVLLDEFGSTLDNANETSCMSSIIAYATGTANPKTHAPLSSWFWWAWQPDSAGTGGIVMNDWRTIVWEKIGLLTGGTKDWVTGMGLAPWYLSAFTDLMPYISSIPTNVSSAAAPVIAVAPKAAVPVLPPSLAPPTDGAFTNSASSSSSTPSSPTPTPVQTVAGTFITGNNSAPVVSNSNSGTTTSSFATYSSTTPVNSATTSSSGLSTGALAGIIVAGVVGIAVIFAAAVLFVKLRQRRPIESYTPSSTASPTSPNMHI